MFLCCRVLQEIEADNCSLVQARLVSTYSINHGREYSGCGFAGGTRGNTAIQDVITWTYSAAAAKTSMAYEAKNLSGSSSGPTVATLYYSGFSDSTRILLRLGTPGDSITFILNSNSPGTNKVKVSVKKTTSRALMQHSVNGTNVRTSAKEYADSKGLYTIFDLGAISIANTGSQSFKFALTGGIIP